MCRHVIVALSALLLLSGTAAAQIGNPAGMGVDTRMAKPGVPAPNQTNNQDRLFAQLAAAGGLAEVELGRMAGQKASADAAKQFADRMVQDHSDANGKLKNLADAAKIPLPTELDADHQVVRDRLDKLNGEAFDRAYIAAQIVDHQTTAQLLAWEISFGEDAEMQRLAGSMLPTVLDHLRQAQEINAALTGAGIRFLPEAMAANAHQP
jgi:putative membrane protein